MEVGHKAYRIHSWEYGPWWFSNESKGRFDLYPYKKLGACYLGAGQVGCFLEVFRSNEPIHIDELNDRRISCLELPDRFRLADCTSGRCRGFGITGEIHTTDDYDLTQAWARAFVDAGFQGIRYKLRHDPSLRSVGYALFHPAGEQNWPAPVPAPISKTLLASLKKQFGIEVLRSIEEGHT